MCGIFGVRGVPNATSCVHLGLYSLQHRGQESSGIVTVDAHGTARARRAMGLVSAMREPDPMCMLWTVPFSLQASKRGSQKRLGSWMDGRPRWCGISGAYVTPL